jgi:molecular chaperone GrpE
MTDEQNKQEENQPEEQKQEDVKSGVCENCEKCKAQAEEYKTGWQRALADYKNLQKETADMRGVWAKASEQYILEEFIPVYENFKLAFKMRMADFSPEQQKWVDGIGHIMKQFGDILKSYQVEEIKTVGEQFDTQLHESVGEEEVVDTATGIIIKEISGGYKRGDKVIKPARVIISK